MRLVFVEAVSPSQWEDSYKGEMDRLVETEAAAIDKTSAEVYKILVDMVHADSNEQRVALLIDMDDVQLKGFVSLTLVADSVAINFFCKNKKVVTVDYMPVMNVYIRKVAKEWGAKRIVCPLQGQLFKHCFKQNFLKNDPVSRKLKWLGLEPKYMIYEGVIGDDG